MAESGWYPDPTGRAGQRWHDGAKWTDHVIAPDGEQGTDSFEPVSPTVATQQPAETAEPERMGAAPLGAIAVAVGAVLAIAGFFVLDWADGGASFGDIQDAADGLSVDTLLELYLDFAAFLGLVAAVILTGVAVAVPGRSGSRTALNLLGAGAAGGAAIYHSYAVAELFAGPADPSIGAWLPVVGYLVMIAGLVIAPLTAKQSGSVSRMPAALTAAAVGLAAIVGVAGASTLAGEEDFTASPSGVNAEGQEDGVSASPAEGGDTSSDGAADDSAIEGLMSTLDGDDHSVGGSPAFDTPAYELGQFLDTAGNGGQRTVRRQGDVVEVCGAGLGSTCLELSNFVLGDSGFSISDMDINGEPLGARLRLDDTSVPDANPNGVISISSKGQLAVPNGPTIVVLVLKQYDERLPQNNGCDGATATLSTAGPSATHQGGGADKGSFLGNSMVINFPTTASVGGTLEMDCHTADGATEHHTVQLPG